MILLRELNINTSKVSYLHALYSHSTGTYATMRSIYHINIIVQSLTKNTGIEHW